MTLTQDVPAVRNGQRCLELFGRLQYDQGRIKLLLNRYQKASKITIEVVGETLGQPLTHTISNDFLSADRRHQPRRAADRGGAARADHAGHRGAHPAPRCRRRRRACAARACSERCSERRSPMGLRDRLMKNEPSTGSFSATVPRTPKPASQQQTRSGALAAPDAHQELKHELHQKLIEKLDLRDDRAAAARSAARRAAHDPEPAARRQRPAAQPRRARADGRGAARRGDRPRAARAAAAPTRPSPTSWSTASTPSTSSGSASWS